MTQGAQKFTEEDLKKAREIAHSIPPCDFGSTEAIKVFAQALRDERKGLEARLAEAVCALKEYAVHQADCVCLDDYVPHSADCAYCDCGLNAFLSSTTNSEAQERQRAKDRVVDCARFVRNNIGCTNQLEIRVMGNLDDALVNLDSLCDKKTGGV